MNSNLPELPCDKCTDWKEDYVFQNREDYFSHIRKLKDWSEYGAITIEDPEEEFQNDQKFLLEFSDDSPLPDIMHFKVTCNKCGARFNIFMDWYHGNGERTRIKSHS